MIVDKFDTLVQKLKWNVLKEVCKSYWNGTLDEDREKIPLIISPGPNSEYRESIDREREIVEERIKLALGGDKENPNMVEVIKSACDQCPFGGMYVTDICRGCIAHRCAQACRIGAISFGPDHRCKIDKTKCVNCGMCAKACQYGAIVNRQRPCEQACKIKAINHANGYASIDEVKCVRCGQCSAACPFGAIMDKSYITKCIDILKEASKGENNVYLILAPSVKTQVRNETLGQAITAFKMMGFTYVTEAALGADIVALNEAKDLEKEGSCTSSCCPAFVMYVKKAFPDLAKKVSNNYSPMAALAKYIKLKDPKAKTVFAGPCIAKKMEMFRENSSKWVDCVITFEELQALVDSREIDTKALEETPLDEASFFGRIFARSGGLSDAVVQAMKENGSEFEVKAVKCSGLDQCRTALTQMKGNRLPGNFLEGMACPGGCIGGPAALKHEPLKDPLTIDKYGQESSLPSIKASLEAINADCSLANNKE